MMNVNTILLSQLQLLQVRETETRKELETQSVEIAKLKEMMRECQDNVSMKVRSLMFYV